MAERWVTGTYLMTGFGAKGNGRKFRVNMAAVYCVERETVLLDEKDADGNWRGECTVINGHLNGHGFTFWAVEMPEHFTDEKPIEYPRLDFNKPIGR